MKLEKAMIEDGGWMIRLRLALARQVCLRWNFGVTREVGGLKVAKMRLCKVLRIKGRWALLGFVGPLNFKKVLAYGHHENSSQRPEFRRSLRTATGGDPGGSGRIKVNQTKSNHFFNHGWTRMDTDGHGWTRMDTDQVRAELVPGAPKKGAAGEEKLNFMGRGQ